MQARVRRRAMLVHATFLVPTTPSWASLARVSMKLLLAFALALSGPAEACGQEPRETKDRIDAQAMAEMVEQPMEAVRERGLAAGEASFERLLAAERARSGPASVRAADLLMAFGIELHFEWAITQDRSLLRAAREHVHSAVAAYRAAFGPHHPEVAVALHSFADIDIRLHDRATAEAQDALREALRIRRAALGPDNVETRATEERLASIDADTGELRRPELPIPR